MTERRRLLDLILADMEDVATGVRLFTFRAPDGGALPAAEAGAAIALHLPKGYVRRYALLHADDAPRAYRIAVQRRPEGRASAWLHAAAREGFRFLADAPSGGFPAAATEAPDAVFFAGGIGIAGLHAAIARRDARGLTSRVHYAARTRSAAPFAAAYAGRAALHLDGDPLDIAAAVAAAPLGAWLCCCGPRAMMQAFARATAGHDPARVHAHWFFPPDEPRLGGFALHLARSGRSVQVPPGETMLGALLADGVALPHACLEGICHRCELRVLDGTPLHYDMPAREGTALACCAGAAGERIVVDL